MNAPTHESSTVEKRRFTDEPFIWRFSPNQTDPQLLEDISVGREPLLQNVLEKISDSAFSGSTHHILLYGPRGIGKSHFTSLLHHRLSNDASLNETVHVAWLHEDETTTSVVQLLVRIYRSLCQRYPDEYSADWLEAMLDQSLEEIAIVLTRRLVARFEKRKLVILIENLNLLFENLGNDGQQQLRSLLQEYPFACLIATSQQLFKAVTDRSEPFFGFFQQIPLKPLSLSEAQQLLVKIAESKGQVDLVQFLKTPDGRGRVRAIHDLAGGNHRVYIVLSGFMTRESLDHLVVPFQKMADDLTPYYQERLRWISPLQRQIVELLCRQHRTVNPKEIARQLLVDQRSIGKQVRILEEIGYLTSTKRGRETFYELSEPLMRLAYEVKEQSLLGLLIEFLRIWYRGDQLQELQSTSRSPLTQVYLKAACERLITAPDRRFELVQAELTKAAADGREHELAELWEEKATASRDVWDWWQAGYYFYLINQDFSKSVACFTAALAADPNFYLAWNGRSASQIYLDNFHEALLDSEKSISIVAENVNAWTNKGIALLGLNSYEPALVCLDRAIEIEPTSAITWHNKAGVLSCIGRSEDALPCFDKAIEIAPQAAHAWYGKGVLLNGRGHFEESLCCFDKALELEPEFADAWDGKGNALNNLGRYEASLLCYDKAHELEPTFPGLLFNRSEALFGLNRWQDGFDSIRRAFALDGQALNALGDVASMFALIFRHSRDQAELQLHVDELVNLYERATIDRKNAPDESVAKSSRSTSSNDIRAIRWPANVSRQDGLNPLSYLADGLVRSLGKIESSRATNSELQSYVSAVEHRVANLPEFEIPLRLFRVGVRYLISHKESEFVVLIQPERNILRQALGLPDVGQSGR